MRKLIIPPQLQQIFDYIKSKKGILAEVPLPEITEMPNYNQFLRVKDNNIALSNHYLKIIPKRTLIHKVTGEDLDLNLPVFEWLLTENSVSSWVDSATGERMLFDVVEVDEEENETPVLDEEGNQVKEPYKIKSLQYLEFLVENLKYKEILALFTKQYKDDIELTDPTFFTRLK